MRNLPHVQLEAVVAHFQRRSVKKGDVLSKKVM